MFYDIYLSLSISLFSFLRFPKTSVLLDIYHVSSAGYAPCVGVMAPNSHKKILSYKNNYIY